MRNPLKKYLGVVPNNHIIVVLLLSLTFIACQSEDNQDNKDDQETQDYFIEWDKSTLVRVADEGGYPRMRRLNDHSLIVAYENWRGDVMVKKSADEGITWGAPVMAYEAFDYTDDQTGGTTRVNIANPEIIQLNNGDLLLAANLRPRNEGVFPFSIALKRSVDKGGTWTEPDMLYQAGTYFKDGCWEPSFLLLPNGTLHLYFANESPYRDSDEQEISMLHSTDHGASWPEEPTTVSFRKGKRDGMPVAVHDGSNIYVAIEDNVSNQFKPYLVQNPIGQPWANPVLGDSPYRYPALRDPLGSQVYAGAPYLIRTDKGIYALSYQTTKSRTSNWELSTMEVVVSDRPSDFRNPSRPFDVPLSKEAKWNSLHDLGDHVIAALASTNFDSDKTGVWMIKGEIIKRNLPE